MIERLQQHAVERALQRAPAVILTGPRQVGKSTLARRIAAGLGDRAVYLDLDADVDRRRLDDPTLFLDAQRGRLTVIDEIHRLPGLLQTLRVLIDARRRAGEGAGHFLLLGSASLDLLRQSGESLAGRAAYIELAPITPLELPEDTGLETLWARGGFPDSLLAATDADSFAWRRDFVRSYLERDIPMFAPRIDPPTVARLWSMLAHAHGTQVHAARLAAGLGVSAPTVTSYIDLLERLLLVRRLRPWSGNVGKRLVRTPKTYLRDSGVLHALLALDRWDAVLGHPIAGTSWEGFAIEALIVAAGPDRTPLFYRTEDGAEIDLVLERGGRVEYAIEIKRSMAPTLSRGATSALSVLEPGRAVVVHGGTGRWALRDSVDAMSVADLARELREGA